MFKNNKKQKNLILKFTNCQIINVNVVDKQSASQILFLLIIRQLIDVGLYERKLVKNHFYLIFYQNRQAQVNFKTDD